MALDTLEVFGTEYTNVKGFKATDDNDAIKAYIRPQGTKSISANGTNIDVAEYASVDVAVPAPTPSLQTKTKTYTPTESQQTESVTADNGYDGLAEVDVTVNAVSSTYVGSGITRRSSTDMTVSGASVTAPAGYYESAGTKSVASGTAGTPTATKGTVSNHAVSVTPSVTNTTGYITGSTKTGTAVSVSASELVSGTLTVDSAGTKDVTNYASASVPSGTAGTPSASKGSVSNHSVSVTPSVTNSTGWITGSTKTGTAVSVSASELVSGSQTITDNANNIDVTNLASVNVAIPFSTIRTGSTDPSSSLGVDGDVYLKTGGGGGGGVTVEALSVTQNGTYTAPTGTAYSPVSVAVSQPDLMRVYVTFNNLAGNAYYIGSDGNERSGTIASGNTATCYVPYNPDAYLKTRIPVCRLQIIGTLPDPSSISVTNGTACFSSDASNLIILPSVTAADMTVTVTKSN